MNAFAHNVIKRIGGVTVTTAVFLGVFAGNARALDYIAAGPKANFVVAKHIGAGLGAGAHMLFGFDLGRAGEFHVYPNFEFWFGHENYWDYRLPYNTDPYYTEIDLWVFELSFNFDARYYFPMPRMVSIAPYVGMGFAPVITIYEWEPNWWQDRYRDDVDVGPAFNMLAGLDIPLGAHKFFMEMKGKFGDGYNLFKLTGGLSFTIR